MTAGNHKTRHRGPLTSMSWNSSFKIQTKLTIGHNARQKLLDSLSQLQVGQRILILHQPSIRDSWLAELDASLFAGNYRLSSLEVPNGDGCKSSEWLLRVWGWLQEECFGRNDTIIAIGGGAVCDLAGFAAATYARGINLILLPTTLLAQVDAAIGGKTAINLPAGKNLAGTFYFPTAVVVDLDYLSTLPARQFNSGMAEIVKYALIEKTIAANSQYKIGPKTLFEVLQANLNGQIEHDNPVLQGIISACIKMKLAVVGADPHESGLRRCLNLGHTLGHALEIVSDYQITHGEAVAVGTAFAFKISSQQKRLPDECNNQVRELLSKAGLPADIPIGLDKEELLNAMSHDKKRQGNKVKFILPEKQLGHVSYDSETALSDLKSWL